MPVDVVIQIFSHQLLQRSLIDVTHVDCVLAPQLFLFLYLEKLFHVQFIVKIKFIILFALVYGSFEIEFTIFLLFVSRIINPLKSFLLLIFTHFRIIQDFRVCKHGFWMRRHYRVVFIVFGFNFVRIDSQIVKSIFGECLMSFVVVYQVVI